MKNSDRESGKGYVLKERYRVCPACGYFVDWSTKDEFCIQCGSRLIEECGQCREPIIYPLAKFCPVCGEKLGKAVNASSNTY